MEPVDPRMAMRLIRLSFERSILYLTRSAVGGGGELLHDTPSRIVPQQGSGEEQGVDTIEHAAVAGKQGAGIFYAGSALDQRFDEIAELRGNIQDDGEQDDGPQFWFFRAKKATAAAIQSNARQEGTNFRGMIKQ